jgi:hypothetical protein
MSNFGSKNSTVEDFHFLKGVSDRICSLMEKNIKGLKTFSADVMECMEDTHIKICQIMEGLDSQPLDPEVKGQLIAKIAEWEK